MIHAHADDLFQGMKVKGCYQFRLTRNADLALDSEEVDDLARALRGELFSRRYGDAVRLEVADTCPKHLSDYLLKQFSLSESELYQGRTARSTLPACSASPASTATRSCNTRRSPRRSPSCW